MNTNNTNINRSQNSGIHHMFSFRHIRSALMVALACGSLGIATAQDVPNLLHFQARLTDNLNNPLNGPTTITVRIWDDQFPFGSVQWSETQVVTALDGAVNTLLGSTSSIPLDLFENGPLYMGVEVFANGEMVPRLAIASVPYARAAADVPGHDINPNTVTINGLEVIDDNGNWVGPPTGLVGPTGLQGPVGPAGATGADGVDGTNGIDGADGVDGTNGVDGADGTDGVDGAPGAPGADGADGATGATGATGDTGAAGATGPTGDNGPVVADNGVSGWGVDNPNAPHKVAASVQPVVGTTIGSAIVYGENPTNTVQVIRMDLTTGTPTTIGSGVVGTPIQFTDFAPTINDYLVLRVNASGISDTLFGGHLNGVDAFPSIYSNTFPNATGLTLDPAVSGVGWGVDASPTTILGVSSFESAPFSLNFNDGVDFLTSPAVIVSGNATTNVGLINLTGSATPVFTFRCNYQTETSSVNGYDRRLLMIDNTPAFSSNEFSGELATTGPTGGMVASPCSAMGLWHTHTVALTPGWGSVQIRFRFDSVDNTINSGAGWFLENFVIADTSAPPVPGTAVQRLTAENFQLNDD